MHYTLPASRISSVKFFGNQVLYFARFTCQIQMQAFPCLDKKISVLLAVFTDGRFNIRKLFNGRHSEHASYRSFAGGSKNGTGRAP